MQPAHGNERLPEGLSFDLVSLDELEAAIALEQAGYPADEAATLDSFKYRQSAASDLFLGAYIPSATTDSAGSPRKIIGYICSTLSQSPMLTHESMSNHDPTLSPSGSSVCIHSVCVDGAYQGRGIASALLKEYVARLSQSNQPSGQPRYARILLIAHEELVPLYQRAGFALAGKSEVSHGSRPWFEMRIDLSLKEEEKQPSQEDILRALRAPRTNRPTARAFTSFTGMPDITEASLNKFDIVCPRSECGSIILKSEVATHVEGAPEQLEPTSSSVNTLLPGMPTDSTAKVNWWLIKPNELVFENIGFTRAVQGGQNANGPAKKFLVCAECELGPLGWCAVGAKEFWLACDRVSYRG